MRLSILALLCLNLACATRIPAQNDHQTFTYYEDDLTRLQLDLFLPENTDSSATPLLIYVHGGGFAGGNRREGHALGRYLKARGIATASISYTLLMRNKNFSCGGITSEKIRAIRTAVNDTWLATAFLLERSDIINIDPDQVFLAGSSAGAETVIHAPYWGETLLDVYGQQLPTNFQYAGVISGAGAIMDINLITKDNQIPTLLFHGDLDPLVPYATAAHHYCPPTATGWLMLFGSKTIFDWIQSMDGSAKLVTHIGAGHEIAGYYFTGDRREEVYDFMFRVLNGEQFISHSVR
ncbi:MAG: alpha/beta hydrolase [Bacteroidota bacterium]